MPLDSLFPRSAMMVPYLGMVLANIGASALYQRAATDGFQLSYVQPDGPTFSVWGAIYTAMLVLCWHARRVAPKARTALRYSFAMNALWLFTNGAAVKGDVSYWLAVAVLWAYLSQLVRAYREMKIDYAKRRWGDVFFVDVAVSMNLAWVVLAAILNATNTAMKPGVDFAVKEFRCAVGGPDWAIGVVGLATLLATWMALERSDVPYCAVTVWALLGIARHQSPDSHFPHPVSDTLRTCALVGAGIVAGAAVVFAPARMWLHVRKWGLGDDSDDESGASRRVDDDAESQPINAMSRGGKTEPLVSSSSSSSS